MRKGVLFCIVVLFLITNVFALGLMPAKKLYNFNSGETIVVDYRVSGISEDGIVEITLEGALAQYATLDKNEIKANEGFRVTLKLPEKIDTPGMNRLVVQVAQKIDTELKTMVGTSVTLRGGIFIDVPYPGKYLDVNLKVPNINVGEVVKFEITLKSQGDEVIHANPRIEVRTSEGDLIQTLIMSERIMQSQENLELQKPYDATSQNPGKYNATAIVEYDSNIAIDSKEFRIGELIINILNYTQKIILDKHQSFSIDIESGWNDVIDGAYAEVSILEEGIEKINFATSTTSLASWERKTIQGFFDTTSFVAGIYDANITVHYFGNDEGRSTSKIVQIEFVQKVNYILIGIIVIIAIVVIIWFIYWNRHRSVYTRRAQDTKLENK